MVGEALQDRQPGLRHEGDTTVSSMVRELVDYVSPELQPVSTESDVILDIEVEGVRCLLVRTEPTPPAQISLSPREQEIARMVAKGYPNKTIAALLEISVWTVSTHLRRIFAKLGVSSRAAMVARLAEERLIGAD